MEFPILLMKAIKLQNSMNILTFCFTEKRDFRIFSMTSIPFSKLMTNQNLEQELQISGKM